jgi:hypothetical protein
LGRGQSTAAAAVVVATTIVISLQQQAHLLFGELLVFLPTDMAVSSSTVKRQLTNTTERASHTHSTTVEDPAPIGEFQEDEGQSTLED